MTKDLLQSTAVLWARFRFSVVGSLLSSPLAHGELKGAIESLAAKTWTHPVSGRDVRFAAVTIERWYYRARREKDDPVSVLRRQTTEAAVPSQGQRQGVPWSGSGPAPV